jgi:hypothetical protein
MALTSRPKLRLVARHVSVRNFNREEVHVSRSSLGAQVPSEWLYDWSSASPLYFMFLPLFSPTLALELFRQKGALGQLMALASRPKLTLTTMNVSVRSP